MSGSTSAFRRFSDPNRFTVGAVGEPGSRLFYFQIFAEGTEVDLKCEKQQAAALAERVVSLLADLPAQEGDQDAVVAPVEALPPTHVDWAVGMISIGVDWKRGRIVIELEEVTVADSEDDAPPPIHPSKVQVHLTPDQVRGFAEQVKVLSGQSRPVCRLCGQPMDPSGHACPRLN